MRGPKKDKKKRQNKNKNVMGYLLFYRCLCPSFFSFFSTSSFPLSPFSHGIPVTEDVALG
jgi:hypothetical protein